MKRIATILILVTMTISISVQSFSASPYQGPTAVPANPGYFIPETLEQLHSVMVRLTRQDGSPLCTASYIAPNLLLSAAHCAVNPYDGKVNDVVLGREKLEILIVDTERDVLILGTKQVNGKYLTLETANAPILFKPTFRACGYGAGVMMCSDIGMFFPENMPQTSVHNVTSNIRPVVGGMSGGPVLDMETGKIVGVNHAGFTDMASDAVRGMGFFIPVPVVHEVLKKMAITVDQLSLVFKSRGKK